MIVPSPVVSPLGGATALLDPETTPLPPTTVTPSLPTMFTGPDPAVAAAAEPDTGVASNSGGAIVADPDSPVLSTAARPFTWAVLPCGSGSPLSLEVLTSTN